MKNALKKLGTALLLAVLVLAAGYVSRGIPFAMAQSVSNYFSQPLGAGSDNALVINGTAKFENVTIPTVATFVEGTEASNRFDVQVSFKDGNGTAIAKPFQTYCWTSNSSVGAAYVTTAGTSAMAAITNGTVESVTTGKSANGISTAAGLLGVRVTQTSASAPDEYLCCTSAVGVPLCSAVLDWS